MTYFTQNKVPFIFANQCRNTFKDLYKAFLSSEILRHFNIELKTILKIDASDGVISGILSQFHLNNELWHPVSFFSKIITALEYNYKIHNKEILIIIQSLQNWRSKLINIHFTIKVFLQLQGLGVFYNNKVSY